MAPYCRTSELKRRNISDAQRVDTLAGMGVVDSEPNIRNKLNRASLQRCFC